METDEAAENVEMEPTADEESSVAEEPAQESSVPNDSTTGAEGEAAEGGEEEEGSIPLVPPPTWQGEVLLEFTGAKITKPDWEKGETPYISYIIDISYHLPPPIEEETREAVTEEAEADTAVTSESTTPMGESIGHRTLSKRWEDFEKLDRELLANENARGAERCRYKRLEGVMGIFGREDPEGGFVTQRRINLQNFSNDIMAVYDDLSEGNKSLLDTFFGVTEIMLEHHRKIAEEEAKRQLEAEPIPDEGSWDSKFLKASDFAFCSCPDDRVE